MTTRQQKRVLPWRQWLLPLMVAVMVTLLMLWGESASALLRYDRDGLARGELWRAVTGHFVHLGWSHLLLNLAGLFLVWLLVGEALSRRGWLLLLSSCSVFLGAALWLFSPLLQWYVGLSGLLHGMLFAGALVQFGGGDRGGAVLGLLVIIKLLWEQRLGPLPGSESVAGGAVIVAAHLYGTVAGGLFLTVALSRRRWREQVLGRVQS
ncbi:MAG: rhombosortase [Gammaproteobacteria bacterium]|nr:rhombosortase [Gammaproteobacteria bacterium]MCW8841602.1 rhombosortase [Gammaproteobacteria bacterium]MCW8959244.1 rhombosortase [Gammaproteobacteria bacterium]MCW8972227.1 rhombosortase [Gammaproteobacteria bacterium]MCW8993728.1 rhombosortase [Gammaproteobacteria bacterium]